MAQLPRGPHPNSLPEGEGIGVGGSPIESGTGTRGRFESPHRSSNPQLGGSRQVMRVRSG